MSRIAGDHGWSGSPTDRLGRDSPSSADLREVTRRLAGVPAASMPAGVSARLDAVLAGEVDRRERRQRLRGGDGRW